MVGLKNQTQLLYISIAVIDKTRFILFKMQRFQAWGEMEEGNNIENKIGWPEEKPMFREN